MLTLDTQQEIALREGTQALRAVADLAAATCDAPAPLAHLEREYLHALLALIHRRIAEAIDPD